MEESDLPGIKTNSKAIIIKQKATILEIGRKQSGRAAETAQ